MTDTLVAQIDRDASSLDGAQIAGYLRQQLGGRVAAHLAGLDDSEQIRRWASGNQVPAVAGEHDLRLREGYKVTRTLVESYDAQTAKAWLFGSNADLGDAAPIELIAAAGRAEDLREVRQAARRFASQGW